MKKTNPILIILIAAVVLVAITLGVILLMGGRYTTLPNGANRASASCQPSGVTVFANSATPISRKRLWSGPSSAAERSSSEAKSKSVDS